MRGETVNGVFVQNKTEGHPTGWCQHSPPTGPRDKANNWPTVYEAETCGQFEEIHIPQYVRIMYERERAENRRLYKKLKRYEQLHIKVGLLGPLVGKKPSDVRLRIIDAIKAALIEKTEATDV